MTMETKASDHIKKALELKKSEKLSDVEMAKIVDFFGGSKNLYYRASIIYKVANRFTDDPEYLVQHCCRLMHNLDLGLMTVNGAYDSYRRSRDYGRASTIIGTYQRRDKPTKKKSKKTDLSNSMSVLEGLCQGLTTVDFSTVQNLDDVEQRMVICRRTLETIINQIRRFNV